MQQRLKKVVIPLAVLGLAIFVANLLVDNPYTHRLIRAAINSQVERSTNMLVDFKALKVDIIPPGVDLYGIYVAPKVTPDEPLVTASHAQARLSVWALILGSFRLSKLEADDLAVVWPPPWNFPGFLKSDDVGPPPEGQIKWPPDFDLPVDRIELKNAKAYVAAPLFAPPEKAKDFTASVVGVDAVFTYKSWHDARLELSVKTADVALGASSMLEDTELAATIELAPERIAVSRLKVAGNRLNFDGTAFADLKLTQPEHFLTALALEASGQVKGDMSVLGSFLDLPDTRGPVDGEVEVHADIPLADPAAAPTFLVKGHGQVHDARLDGFRLYNSKAVFAIDEQAVSFPEIDVIVGETSVGKGKGAIKLTDQIDFDFHVQPSGLHLVDLLEALKVDFNTVDVAIASPDLRINGEGEPFHLNVSATAGFTDVTLPETPYDHGKYPVSPACRFDFHLLVTSAQLDFNGSHGNCFQPLAGMALGPPAPGQIEAPRGATAVSPVDFGGQIRLEGQEGVGLKVRSSSLDLALGQYFAQVPLVGRGTLETEVHGPFDHVLIDNRLSSASVEVMSIPLGAVTAKATVDGKVVKWSGTTVKPAGGGQIDLPAGSLDLTTEDYRIKTELRATDIGRETVRQIVASFAKDVDFAASVKTLDGTFEAPLFFPLAGLGKVHLALGQATLGGETLFDTLGGTVQATEKGWTTDDLVATLGSLAVAAKLTHKRAEPFSFAAASAATETWAVLGLSPNDRFDAELATLEPKGPLPDVKSAEAGPEDDDHLGRLPFVGDELKEAGIKGLISAQGRFTGTTADVQGTFNATLKQVSVFGARMAPVNAKGFVKGSRLDLVLDHSGNSLEGRLSLDLMKPGVPYEWFFHMNRLDLRALGTGVVHADPRNYIYLTADWRMQGTFADWWRSTGELDIKDLRGKYVQDIAAQTRTLAVRQEQPVKLLFTKDGWRFEDDKDLYLSGRNVQLRLSMQDSRPPERLGLRLESIVDMGIAKEFLPEVDTAEGKLRIVAEVPGSTSEPKPTVEITDLKPNPFIAATWKPVTLGIADIRPAFRNVRLRVLYENGRLVIDKLSADKGTGSVTANGRLNLSAASTDESRLDINFNDATVVYPVAFLKSFETQMSGNVVVSGQGVPYRIAGDVVVNKARSTREVDIRDEIINALRQKSFNTGLVSEKPTFLFDLNVAANQTINIHNRNLQTVLSADLHIKGTDIAPSVSGQVAVDKGKFIYKQEFSITRGVVTFDDPVKPDPSLDILAVSEVDVYRVYIAVTGHASNPTVEFSVDPPTRESGTPISKLEILVLLSRGKLPEESRSLGQETQQAAASEAANLILGQFEEPVEKLLDASGQSFVRNVYIDTHPSPADGSPVPRLNLPLDLGEDVDLVVRTDQDTSEVSLEYNLNDSISFTGSRDFSRNKEPVVNQTTETAVPVEDAKVNLKFRFSFE